MSLVKRETQSGHGFSNLEAVGHNGTNYQLAQATSAGVPAIALVKDVSTDKFTALFLGLHRIRNHGLSDGVNYLSADTAGALVTTPDGGKIQPVCFVIDSDWLVVYGAQGMIW